MNKNGQVVFPGDVVGNSDHFFAGKGVLVEGSQLVATLMGTVEAIQLPSPSNVPINKPTLIVMPLHTPIASDYVVKVGDNVIGKVLRTNNNQAYIDVHMVEETILHFPVKAVIRREDIRREEVDKVVVNEFLLPLDIVKAKVLSLGDNKYYFLTIAADGYGVIKRADS